MFLLDRLLRLVRAAKLPLQMLWAAPVTVLCFAFYVLPCWALGWYKYHGKLGNSWVWLHGNMPNWLREMWNHWDGQSVGNCIVLRENPRNSPQALQMLVHEQEHTRQVMTWGPLQPIFYSLASLALWMAGEDSYWTNPFEIAARRAAGQKINIK